MRTQTFANGETGLLVRTKLNSMASWDPVYAYNADDITHYSGSVWMSLIDNNTGSVPLNSLYWMNSCASGSVSVSSSYSDSSLNSSFSISSSYSDLSWSSSFSNSSSYALNCAHNDTASYLTPTILFTLDRLQNNFGLADGSSSVAFNGTAHGRFSHVEGTRSLAYGESSHAEGNDTYCYGNSSHTEGSGSLSGVRGWNIEDVLGSSSGSRFHLPYNFGTLSTLFAVGDTCVFYIGDITQSFVSNISSIYVNPNDVVTTCVLVDIPDLVGINGVFTSLKNKNIGPVYVTQSVNSHAEGLNTIAFGIGSHAEGESTVAVGTTSHAGGFNTIAIASHQTVVGQYNSPNTRSLFAVGNGITELTRSNVFEVNSNGVYVNGSITSSMLNFPTGSGRPIVSGSAATWMPVQFNGQLYYMPLYQ